MFFRRNKTPIPEMDVITLNGKLKAEARLILVDVREPEEHADGIILGAKMIPMRQIKSVFPTLVHDKNQEIVVYCRSGHRSQISAREILEMGYTNVFSLRGGILSWFREGYQIEFPKKSI
ncbi:MAG: rhodanese-like domain-containing protein [bacterium]|nr:rhodanese-like domain-containing protein [bacterium]